MNNIPEGKQQIYVEATYKEPIEGVPFSNVGITVGVSKYIDDKPGEIEKIIAENTQKAVERYTAKLQEAMLKGRNEVVDNLRVELDKKYAENIKALKDEVIKLRKQLK